MMDEWENGVCPTLKQGFIKHVPGLTNPSQKKLNDIYIFQIYFKLNVDRYRDMGFFLNKNVNRKKKDFIYQAKGEW